MTKSTFSLKDQLFNPKKIDWLAEGIQFVFPDFEREMFVKHTTEMFAELELKQRITHIAQMFREYLPDVYETALDILIQSLPAELDPTKNDDDFGDFIYAPYGEFVALFGCNREYLDVSRQAMTEITKRFSVELSIRDFINMFPSEMLERFAELAESHNYHQRRLVSEWSRPRLPRAKKIVWTQIETLPLLELLYADKTRYVTRSVANHLNDISKINPELVLETLRRRQKSWRQTESEMFFLTKHSLRTLLKSWHTKALTMLWYESPDHIHMSDMFLDKSVRLWDELSFGCTIQTDDEKLGLCRIEYVIGYKKKNWSLSHKVFKIGEWVLDNVSHSYTKKQSFKNMTTRIHYAWMHTIAIIVNGKRFEEREFEVVE